MESKTSNDRRRFLRQAMVGAGVAGGLWVAPDIRSMAVAQTGTCTRSVLDWLTLFPSGGAFPSPNPQSIVVGSRTVSIAHSSVGTNPNPTTPTINVTSPPSAGGNGSGNQVGYWRVGWPTGAAGANAQTQTIVFTFSQTVHDVCFLITDMDAQTTSGWRDNVTISATGPGTRTISSITTTGTWPGGANNPGAQGSRVTGSSPTWSASLGGDVPSNQTAGNLAVCVDGQVDSFTILYTAGPETGQSQHIGIFNPNWCV